MTVKITYKLIEVTKVETYENVSFDVIDGGITLTDKHNKIEAIYFNNSLVRLEVINDN